MTLADRLDHFVRWFFNSSPTRVVEPRVGAAQRPGGGASPGTAFGDSRNAAR